MRTALFTASWLNALASIQSLNVTFVGVGSRQYLEAVPALEAAVIFINHNFYPFLNVSLRLAFSFETYRCEVNAENIVDDSSKLYYQARRRSRSDDMTVVIGPTCVAEILMMAPLMNELNVLFASTVGTDPRVSDKRLFATTIAVAPLHHTVLVRGFQKLMQLYGWTSLFLVCDENNIVSFFRTVCRNLTASAWMVKSVLLTTMAINSDLGPIDYDRVLDNAARSARIIYLLTTAEHVRNFMVHAKRKLMTNSEYVRAFDTGLATPPGVAFESFLADLYYYDGSGRQVYFTSFPFIFHEFQLPKWQIGADDDQEAKEAFRQLFVFMFDNDQVPNSIPLTTQEFIKTRSVFYNISYGVNEHITAPVVAAYEAAVLLAQVIHDSLSLEVSHRHDARVFARRFFNRTFSTFTNDIYLNENGDRLPTMTMRQLNQGTGATEPIILYDLQKDLISTINNISISPAWIDGHPPTGRPRCGFDGQDPVCEREKLNSLYAIPGVFVFIAMLVLAVEFTRRRISRTSSDRDTWWIITTDLVVKYLSPFSKSSSKTFCRVP